MMCQPLGRSEYCWRIRGTILSAGSGLVTVVHISIYTYTKSSIGSCEMVLDAEIDRLRGFKARWLRVHPKVATSQQILERHFLGVLGLLVSQTQLCQYL